MATALGYGLGLPFARTQIGIGVGAGASFTWQVLPGSLPPGMVYTGASLKTQVNADGSLSYGPHNLVLQSQALFNAAWTLGNGATATPNSDFDPAGQATCVTLASASGYGYSQQVIGIGLDTYTASVYVKKTASSAVMGLATSTVGGAFEASFNTQTGVVASQGGSITAAGAIDAGNFWRIWATSVISNPSFRVFAGYPTSVSPSVTWAQLNAGPLQPYYPTTSAAYYGLRTADYSDSIGTANVRPGIKIEPKATNLFLNSEAPATQNITVTATAHTLSCYGTGSIVVTGTGAGTLTASGSATQRTTLTFTPTAGVVILTVIGTAKVQLETGPVATSYIATGSSQVTRVADVLYCPTSSIPGFDATNGSFYMALISNAPNSTAPISFAGNAATGNSGQFIGGGSGQESLWNNAVAFGTANTVAAGVLRKSASAYQPTTRSVVLNGGTVATSATAYWTVAPTAIHLGATATGGQSTNGSIYNLRYYPTALPSANLQALTA